MLLLALIFGTFWMAVTGTSVIDPSTGNILVDVFELIQNSAITQFTSAIFVIGICMGYVSWLEQIKAPAKFTELVAIPLIRMNKPYLMLAIAFVISSLVKFAIPAPSSILTPSRQYPHS